MTVAGHARYAFSLRKRSATSLPGPLKSPQSRRSGPGRGVQTAESEFTQGPLAWQKQWGSDIGDGGGSLVRWLCKAPLAVAMEDDDTQCPLIVARLSGFSSKRPV